MCWGLVEKHQRLIYYYFQKWPENSRGTVFESQLVWRLRWISSIVILMQIHHVYFNNSFFFFFFFFAIFLSVRQAAAAAAKSLQLCPILCDLIDSRAPGSSVPGILQAWILERVAISFSNAWKWKVKMKLLSRVRLFETPWTVAYQASLSMGFSRQEYQSGLPLPSLSDKAYKQLAS